MKEHVFPGDGEMARLCRERDWSATPLGPVAGWPQSLRTMVATLLASRQPMWLYWGPECVGIYNDAYRPSLGEGGRHPRALGAPAAECWTDIWDTMGPQVRAIMAGGPAVWQEDQLVPIERNGRLEEVYWTYNQSAVRGEGGAILGVLVTCQETTSRVLAERATERVLARLEHERRRLHEVFQKAPNFMAVVRGPDHVFEFANDAYYSLVGFRPLLGLTVAQALPEVRGQGYLELLDEVLRTGRPFTGRGRRVLLQKTPGAPAEERLVDFVYHPLVDEDGVCEGILCQGVDVTERVQARCADRSAPGAGAQELTE